jgi:hypothetical protein
MRTISASHRIVLVLSHYLVFSDLFDKYEDLGAKLKGGKVNASQCGVGGIRHAPEYGLGTCGRPWIKKAHGTITGDLGNNCDLNDVGLIVTYMLCKPEK